MDIKHKTCDIRNWKKHLFLDISSTIDTLAPSLYQCVQTLGTEIFWLLSHCQPHHHLRFNLDSSSSESRRSQSYSDFTTGDLPPVRLGVKLHVAHDQNLFFLSPTSFSSLHYTDLIENTASNSSFVFHVYSLQR
jgi:hypothetical protein